MKLREVYRYELEHRVRSGATWAYAVILLLLATWMYLATTDGASASNLANAPERLAGAAVLPGMFGMLISAALFGDAALRDVQSGMDPLVYASPVTKLEYLGGRFLGALTVNAALLFAIIFGGVAATSIVAAFEPETVGPFSFAAYAQAYLLFLLPNVVVVGAIQFAIGALTRQIVPVFLATIGIFIGYVVALNYAGRFDSALLVVLLDPIGLVSLQEVTRYWTEQEHNTRLVGAALLYANRAVWLAIGVVVLALLVRRFRFAHPDGGADRRRQHVREAPAPTRSGPLAVPRVAGTFGWRARVRQTFSVAGQSLAELASSRWAMAVPFACVGFTLLWGWNVGETVFETPVWPVTALVAEEVTSQRVVPIIYLLLAMFAGELVWKQREVGEAEIADAAPVPEGVALAGRFLALVAIIAVIQLSVMVGAILIQALHGYYRIEPGLYLSILFGLNFADYVLFGALAIAVHVVLNHKYLAHMVTLLVLISTIALPAMRIVQHHLLLYGTDPGWTYSDMNGFGPFLEPFVWFKLYWGAWALLLGVVAVLFQVRGREAGTRARLRLVRARFGGRVARVAVVAITLIVAFGGFVFYNTNVLNDYAPREAGRRHALYETRYARLADAPQPTITSARLHIEILPDAPAVETRGAYTLVNRSGVAIDTIHVSMYDPAIALQELSFDRDASALTIDDEAGFRSYALAAPLAPGDSLVLSFAVAYRPRGFPNADIPTQVVGNGAFFDRRWLPFVGYQPVFELRGADARERWDLAERAPALRPQVATDLDRRHPFTDADLVHVDATIGTASDQIAVTPGTLRRTWTEGGRRYFRYVTDTPLAFGGTVFSASYDVAEDRWNDVALRVFHHPAHGNENVARMIASMKASLGYFSVQFGPYPYAQLNIVENPRYGGFGHAHPETIGFTEDVFYARPAVDRFDQTFYGTAHEVAHTWWGGLVRGADGVRGSALLSEALANYSAMMVTEKQFGRDAAREVYDYQLNRYLVRRGRGDVPLLEVEDQPWIYYGKGAAVLYLLREYIGEDAVNGALRRLVEQHHAGVPPFPTSLDLYRELRAAAPDSLHPLLADLFETVTTWDLRTERATVERRPDGRYDVTLDVVASKAREDSTGVAAEAPMDDPIEIGVFAAGENGARGDTLYLERHRIRSGRQTITVTVPRMPAHAGVDPYRMLIDRERDDNVVAME
ncbi:MAG TPA: M1 family aminopeptidase [Longimicrobiales bacterium]